MAWRELEKAWHDTSVDYCDVCGNLLIGRYWEFEGEGGRPVRACCEDDEELVTWLSERYAGTGGE